MTRKWGMMAGLLVVAACGDKGGAQADKATDVAAAAQSVALSPFVAGASEEIPTAPCSGNIIGDPLIMVISNQMLKQLGGNDQQIDRDVSRGGKGLAPPGLTNKKLYPTNLDLPANGVGKAGDYVQIQIKLQPTDPTKRDLTFIRMDASAPPAYGDSSAGAVTVRKGDAIHFCGRKTIAKDPATGMETVIFGSMLGKYMESSINIGVLIQNKKDPTKSTPIYIDPNVRNEG